MVQWQHTGFWFRQSPFESGWGNQEIPTWRNGSRDWLKINCRMACRFDSGRGYKADRAFSRK